MSKQRIGYIGVGLMGHGVAKNMLQNGYPLTIMGHCNRAPVDDLVALGAREAASSACSSLRCSPRSSEPARPERDEEVFGEVFGLFLGFGIALVIAPAAGGGGGIEGKYEKSFQSHVRPPLGVRQDFSRSLPSQN